MPSYPALFLKSGSDVHLRNRHHAIFKSAIGRVPAAEDGDIVEVKSSTGDFLCYATYNAKAYICGRAISFDPGDPLASLKESMRSSIALRKQFLQNEDTTAYRLINAEGDGIPGLIVDRYGDVIVLQCTTLGMDRLREWVAETLMDITGLSSVFEKSTGSARSKEGLEPREGWLKGSGSTSIPVIERGVKFQIELQGSQKTGLFIDQREMRSLVRLLAKDKTVLDCCSYVGGFSVSALMGGAKAADAIDYDPQAIGRAKEHVMNNGIDAQKFGAYAEDVFTFLRRRPYPRQYDFIVLDPPAFAKRSSDIDQAKRAYTDLNRLAMQILPKGGLLLTCSCSYHVDMQMFQTIVFHAARQAKRGARILQRHRQAFDHPVNLYHPEVDYLKSLLLWIE